MEFVEKERQWMQANADFIVGKAWDESIDRLTSDIHCWVAREGGQFDEIDSFIEEVQQKLEALQETITKATGA